MVTIPKIPIIMPAIRFIVRMWCGRKPRLNRLISSERINHHNAAPAKKPQRIRALFNIEVKSFELSCADTPNIAKKARIYGIIEMKLASVNPNIDAKSRHDDEFFGRSLLICVVGFLKKMATPTISTKIPPKTVIISSYSLICDSKRE